MKTALLLIALSITIVAFSQAVAFGLMARYALMRVFLGVGAVAALATAAIYAAWFR